MSKQGVSVKQAAEELGTTAKWVRRHIADGTIAPKRQGSKRNGRFVLSDTDVEALRARVAAAAPAAEPAAGDPPAVDDGGGAIALARITQLEADRANLLAQVAWARAISTEQLKTLEAERERAATLAAELEAQRARVEALKSLSILDRILGRHKSV